LKADADARDLLASALGQSAILSDWASDRSLDRSRSSAFRDQKKIVKS
jgi:hypothetical protein